jgi:hypothetical protein
METVHCRRRHFGCNARADHHLGATDPHCGGVYWHIRSIRYHHPGSGHHLDHFWCQTAQDFGGQHGKSAKEFKSVPQGSYRFDNLIPLNSNILMNFFTIVDHFDYFVRLFFDCNADRGSFDANSLRKSPSIQNYLRDWSLLIRDYGYYASAIVLNKEQEKSYILFEIWTQIE